MAAEVPRSVRRQRGAIPAWREWRLVRHIETGEYALGSLWSPELWEGPVFHADKLPDEPEARGNPGVYAWRPEHANPSQFGFPVRGHVLLYGRVVAHERGYRAQHALIQDLRVVYTPDDELGSAILVAGLWYDPAESCWLSMQGYQEIVGGTRQDPVLSVTRSLERRYGCEVHGLEITREELEELWASENP